MAKFSVLVFGDGFRLPVIDGDPEYAEAFLVWRCVEAESREEAAALAFDSVLGDPNTTGLEPRLKVKELHEVEDFGDLTPPGSGFIWM